MKQVIKFEDVKSVLIELRGEQVLLDRDVAALYGVETRDINKAVKNNPSKFPDGYIFSLEKTEKNELVENFHRFEPLKHSTVLPRAFTEKGLYMLATILKSPTATQTTIAIIETFAKVRELARTMGELSNQPDKYRQQSLMEKSGDIIADLFGNEMQTTDTETEIELNLAVLKIKHTVKRKN